MGNGQTCTHVANAFHEDIHVKIDADRKYVTLIDFKEAVAVEVDGMKVSASGGIKTQYDWKFAKKEGYTRIAPRSYLGFHPDTDRGTVYITVLTSSGEVVCHCFAFREDYSVIVDKGGYIRATKYGEIWVDRAGHDHRH